MPRFRLNLIGDEVIRDKEGHDVSSVDIAIACAVTSARELMADRIVSGQIVHLHHRIEITDAGGSILYTVVFADVVRFIV